MANENVTEPKVPMTLTEDWVDVTWNSVPGLSSPERHAFNRLQRSISGAVAVSRVLLRDENARNEVADRREVDGEQVHYTPLTISHREMLGNALTVLLETATLQIENLPSTLNNAKGGELA